MSSVGQAVGMVVGGIIGAFIPGGYIMLGAAIGGAIGGYIDPPKGKDVVGPRLEDLTVQTSTYGAILPRVKGTVGVTGNVVWLEGDKIKEHKKTKKVGGKGGGGAKQTTYSYSATFAVGLSHQITGPITAVRRLWIGNNLIFEASSGNIESIIASASNLAVTATKNSTASISSISSVSPTYAIYYGSDDQQPDPRIQADKGVANVSGYPGRCYIVFYDLDLTEHYQNTLMGAQVKVELTTGDHDLSSAALFDLHGSFASGSGRDVYSMLFGPASAIYGVFDYQTWDQNITGVELWEAEYGVTERLISSYSTSSAPFGEGNYRLFICQSDRPVLMTLEGNDDGYGHISTWLVWFEQGGTITRMQEMFYTDTVYLPYHDYSVAIDGGDTFLTWNTDSPVYKVSGTTLVTTSSGSYKIEKCGLSESYLFGVYDSGYPSSSTTVYKFDRSTLTLVDTYTQSVTGTNAVLHVVDDDTFYTLASDHVYKWVGGVVTADLGLLLPFSASTDGLRAWFRIVSDAPPYGFVFTRPASGTTLTGYVGYQTVDAEVAKLRDIVTEECALVGITSGDLDLTELTNSDVRGYRVSSAGSVRTVLEQLQAVFPFDVIQSGYKLKFKSRGGSSVLTVPEADLGAHTGSDAQSRFMTVKEMPSQVPAKVTFNFLNADREYDPDEQSATFTAQDVKNSYTVSLPLVMTPTEALRAADVLLRKEQVERTTVGTFWLPPADNYRKLEAADVIDVIAQGRTHTLRLTKVTNLSDGRVECDGKLTASAAYTSTAQAQDSLALGQTLVPLIGSSDLVLLDIPRIVSDQDVPGISLGMYGYTSSWPGAIAFRSDDSGETYNAIVSFLDKTEVFTAGAAIGVANGYAIDNASELTVTPKWSGADLYSITETQLYAHGNLAAYGVDGRWEILCFKTVATSGSNYILRDFRRGLYGTEWATSLHQTGDLLVMLDINTNDFAGLPLTAINSPRLWRGVTSGAILDSATDIEHTYTGANLKPLSPVDFKGERSAYTLNWNLSWMWRTRTPVEIFSGLAVPASESPELYDIEIWDSSYTVLKRSFASLSSAACSYTAAMQITDFASLQDTVYAKIYQYSATVGRGFVSNSSVSDSMPPDPLGSSVGFLLQMEGANGSTTFTDEKGHAFTAYGNAQLTTTDPLSGTSSGLFDGNGDYLQCPDAADLEPGAGAFTFEAFVKLSAYNASPYVAVIVSREHSSGVNMKWYLAGTASAWTTIGFSMNFIEITASVSLALNTKYHLAVCRSGNTLRFFVDGVQAGGDLAFNYTIGNEAFPWTIGATPYSTMRYYFPGRLDAVRYTKAARYTANFVPPVQLPNP